MKSLQEKIREENKKAHDNHYAMIEPIILDLSTIVVIAEEAIEEKWISIEKSLPELGKKVIVNLDNGFVTLIGRLNTNGWSAFFVDGEKLCQIATVSHWMPLPSFPNQSKEEEE